MGCGTGQGKISYNKKRSKQPKCLGIHPEFLKSLEVQSLASNVRKQISASRLQGKPVAGFNYSTSFLLNHYLKVSAMVFELSVFFGLRGKI